MPEVKHRNVGRYSVAIKMKARELRKKGMTHREVAKGLGISLGSAHLWTAMITLTKEQKRAIRKRSAEQAFFPERRRRLSEAARVNLAAYREKYTKEILLEKIVGFYRRHGRIPLKREFNMHREYKLRFGSWNNAIKLAGFNPNPVLFSYKFKARDGHFCDSFTEKIIDDWLSVRRIFHQRNVRYGGTKMTADFFIPPRTVMEFFGLAGVQKSYDEIIERKKELCRKLKLHLVSVYPEDIFPHNSLSRLLRSAR